EAEDQALAGLVITQGGARPVESGRAAGTFAAQRALPQIELERHAATGAARRAEKRQTAPAFGAQRPGGRDRAAASVAVNLPADGGAKPPQSVRPARGAALSRTRGAELGRGGFPRRGNRR